MAKVATTYQNFGQGQADHNLQGRFDLSIYANALDKCYQFYTDFKGNLIYREGFQNIYAFEDCVLQEFKFSNSQNYLMVFYNTKIRFLSYDINGNFGWVLFSGSPLEVTTPYTLAQCKELQFSQNRDVITITSDAHLPRELTRVSATSFTLTVPAFKKDPFALTWDASKTITAITLAASAQITSAAHGYANGDRVLIESVVGMTQINNYTGTVTVIDGNNFTVNINSTTFTAYTSGGTAKKVLTNDFAACVCYYKGRRYFGRLTSRPTAIMASESGIYDNYDIAPSTITASSPFKVELTDISERVEWLFGGDNSLIVGAQDGIVALNSGSVSEPISAETVEGNITSADSANYVIPLRKDSEVFYVGKTGRNVNTFSYNLLSESFVSSDVNLVAYDITDSGLKKIRYKKDRFNLIWGVKENGKLTSLAYFKSDQEVIRGWHEHETEGLFKDIATISDNDGNPQLFALALIGGVYYIMKKAEPVEFVLSHNFYTDEDSETADRNAWYRKTAELLKGCNYLDCSESFSNLKSNLITFNGTNTITATSGVFVVGDIGRHIVYKTSTGYESGRFLITGYTSTTVVTVEVLQTPTSNIYTDWYLTFKSISGLSRFNGLSVGVVADGAYQGDYTVTAGALDIDKQVTHMVVGYRYRGVAKSFPMGVISGGNNTQMNIKRLMRVGLRSTTSLGGQFGSSMYKLQAVQKMTSSDLNYLPPLPMDRTTFIDIVDDGQKDKHWYFVQDEPLPFNVNCIMIEAEYAIT